MPTEIEAKFRADGPGPLRDLLHVARLGPATLGTPSTETETDRYLDTADGALAAGRWACRLRERGGRTVVSLKGPAEAATVDGVHRRPELEGPATSDADPASWPPSPAREHLDTLRRGAPLVERFTLRQERVEREVRLDTASIGTLSLDTVEVLHDGRRRGTLHLAEIELHADGAEGRLASLSTLADVLAEFPGLAIDPQTKLEHALELIERPTAPDP